MSILEFHKCRTPTVLSVSHNWIWFLRGHPFMTSTRKQVLAISELL